MHGAKQRTILKRTLVGVVGGTLIGGAIWLTVVWLHEHRTTARADAHVREILSMLDLAAMPDFHQRLDKVRTFINDHSIHKIDEIFWANHGNPDTVLAGLLAHAKGTGVEPIHMECSTRTGVMGRILKALGYETRVVAIFNSKTNLKSHSFLEVMNPVTKRWETQDADYDVYWRSKISGVRISLAEGAQSIDDIEPCGRNECGWGHVSREGIKANKLIDYLDLISITEKQKAIRYTLFTSRADFNRTYSKGSKKGSFCEVETKRCEHGFYNITEYGTYQH
jgi:hypothetical protein